MDKFSWSTKVLPVTLKFEGGKVNDPRDPGGRTNQGVTQNVYNTYCFENKLPVESVYNMTPDQRDNIYYNKYFTPIGGLSLSAGRCMVDFDCAVHSGPGRTTAFRKKIGVMSDDVTYVHKFSDARMSFLQSLKTWSTFGKGWGRRVGTCEAEAIKLCTISPTTKASTIATQANKSRDDAERRKKAAQGSAAAGTVAVPTAGTTAHPWLLAGTIAVITVVIVGCVVVLVRMHKERSNALQEALGTV